jgi:hypothetical protein
MKKIVRRAYPIEVSVFMLAFIFLVAFLFTYDIFNVTFNSAAHNKTAYLGMFLVGTATVIALLIIWEELLFPVIVKQGNDTLRVSNHRTKLRTQALIYLVIPAIFLFIYMNFSINVFHFAIWAGMCMVIPIVAKIFSGIKNYNDYLKLSPYDIEYKNNEKEGKFQLAEVRYISMVKDDHNVLSKLTLGVNHAEVIIDLDEMELEAYYETIEEFTKKTYQHLLK